MNERCRVLDGDAFYPFVSIVRAYRAEAKNASYTLHPTPGVLDCPKCLTDEVWTGPLGLSCSRCGHLVWRRPPAPPRSRLLPACPECGFLVVAEPTGDPPLMLPCRECGGMVPNPERNDVPSDLKPLSG